MAKHKAPTQVTIAPLAERSLFDDFIAKSWKMGVLVAVGVTAIIVYSHERSERERSAGEDSWNDLLASVDLESLSASNLLPTSEDLAPVMTQLAGSDAAVWGKIFDSRSLLQARQHDRAQASLSAIKSDFAHHPITSGSFYCGEASGIRTLIVEMEANLSSNQRWDMSHPALYGPPDLPDNAPRVRLETSNGPIVVGLYVDRAPKHVENFLTLCRAGYYDGTRFHRVLRDLLIQGGDPNSRNLDSKALGTGGPDYTILPEVSDAWHFAGMLSAAAKPGEIESSGSQFFITAAAAHQFDKHYTVFGRVLEGEGLVEKMAKDAPEQSDRPADQVVLESATVL